MSDFISTGMVEPFENPLGNLAANIGLFVGLDKGSDLVKMDISRQLAGRTGPGLMLRELGGSKPLTNRALSRSRGILFGRIGPEDRVMAAAYDFTKKFNDVKYKGERVHLRNFARPGMWQGHGFQGTRAWMFGGEKAAERFGGAAATRSLAMKEIGASVLGFAGKAFNIMMISDLTKVGMFAFGAIDLAGIYESRGKAEATKTARSQNMLTMSPGFHDNRGAATMRQRGLEAIHNTQMNIQQVYGNEATHVHS